MFEVTKARPAEPRCGQFTCRRCGREVFRARSKKSEKLVTIDGRVGPYVLEEQADGTVLAAHYGPEDGYAYHYNEDKQCASDEEVVERL